MRRPTIADLAEASCLSISTVDRVLSGRNPVSRAKAEKVLATARAIGFHAAPAIHQRIAAERPARTLGFILQRERGAFYRDLGTALRQAVEGSTAIRGRSKIDFVEDLSPGSIAEHIAALAKVVDVIAVVAADHSRVSQAIEQAAARGVPVLALISDLTAPARAGYAGLDNWKVGRTAAWAVSNMCHSAGKVGILVGSHRYLCQDAAEMSFRSYFREHAPHFSLMESLSTFEDPTYAYENTRDLLGRNPDLVALFVAGGGIEGVVRAIKDGGAADRVITIGRDLTEDTRSALIEGSVKLILSHPIAEMATAMIKAMVVARQDSPPPFQQCLLPFNLWTAENV